MKIIFAYNMWDQWAHEYHIRIAAEGNKAGLTVIPFVLTPDAPAPRLGWEELDFLWSRRHTLMASAKRKKLRALLKMREELLAAAQDADVLWVYNGANFHPAWLADFPKDLLTVYGCFDDPESSSNLSEPIAPYFDACLVGNIAATPLYQKWGCRQVEWSPIFCTTGQPEISEDTFFSEQRDIPLIFCGERESPWRRERLDYVAQAFPDALFYGRGWKNGFVDESKRLQLYQRTQVGLNLHNSIGPINLRTFELPAHGVMQICDNKCRLGNIFRLGSEAVGYDSIAEGVELIRYYNAHPEECRKIAWSGYCRYWKDYAPQAIWIRAAVLFEGWKKAKDAGTLFAPRQTRTTSIAEEILLPAKPVVKKAVRVLRAVRRAFYEESPTVRVPSDFFYHYATPELPVCPPHSPNPEPGPFNLEEKEFCLKEYGFFEWPNMVALNWTVASLVGSDKKIIEVGSGTGCFASEASVDHSRSFLCLEAEARARAWAQEHRSRPNIEYADKRLEDLGERTFDLAVAVDIVEHIKEYQSFLHQCARVARRAIITTPNRFRYGERSLTPGYIHHVQEWNAGEFYYILNNFWKNVNLYAMQDPFIPICIPCDINTELHPLIAVCSHAER